MEERRKTDRIGNQENRTINWFKKNVPLLLLALSPTIFLASGMLLYNEYRISEFKSMGERNFELEGIANQYGSFQVYELEECPDTWNGKTFPYRDVIFICPSKNTKESIILHEVGHNIYVYNLTKEQRSEWDSQFEDFDCSVGVPESMKSYYCDYYYLPDETFARNFAENKLNLSTEHSNFFKTNHIGGL